MRKYFITAILLSLTTICFAQQSTIVFDQEGRIIKNYGIEKYSDEYTFLIEGVSRSDFNNYYIIYQWRNDYLYGANNTFEGNSVTHIGKFNDQGYLKISDVPKNDNKIVPLLSYQLIKVNEKGKDFFEACINNSSECMMTLNRLEILNSSYVNNKIENLITFDCTIAKNYLIKETNDFFLKLHENNKRTDINIEISLLIKLINEINNIIVDDFIKKILELEIHEENLRELENKKKQGSFSGGYQSLLREISLLEKKLEIREQQLERLGGNTKECCDADNIDSVTIQIIDIAETIHVKKNLVDSLLNQHHDSIKTVQRKITSIENEIEGIITDENKFNINISPVYTFLHLGVLVLSNDNRFEIVYDVDSQELFDSGINTFNVARLTPDLPQLTTESELILRILNLSSPDLNENPFIISMESNLSAEVAIESPANFQPLQSVDIGSSFPNIDPDIWDNLKSIIDSPKGSSENNIDLQLLDEIKKQIQDQINIDDRVNERLNELDDDEKIQKAKDYITKIISSKLNKNPNYTDYLLKYPKPFEPFKSPSIALKAVQPEAENFSQKVAEGTLKNESYDIKYVTKTLVADTLPPVHRLYRFALNTGLVASKNVSYSYRRTPLPNSSVDQLDEIKDVSFQIRPILTLSTYFWKQDLAVDPDLTNLLKFRENAWVELLKTAHIDIGLNYAQKNIFDDLYFGIGFEPARLINIGGGIKISKVNKVDPQKLDPVTLDTSSAKTNETKFRFYFGVNLGLNIIPAAINALIK